MLCMTFTGLQDVSGIFQFYTHDNQIDPRALRIAQDHRS